MNEAPDKALPHIVTALVAKRRELAREDYERGLRAASEQAFFRQ